MVRPSDERGGRGRTSSTHAPTLCPSSQGRHEDLGFFSLRCNRGMPLLLAAGGSAVKGTLRKKQHWRLWARVLGESSSPTPAVAFQRDGAAGSQF